MTQHPWSADGMRITQPGRFRTIAECHCNQHVTRDEALAHARMCAAAPEMMEALEKAADTLAMARERLEKFGYMQAAKDCADDEAAARAALAKARGE